MEKSPAEKTPDEGGLHRWDGRLSLTITLATAIGLLVFISVGIVLGVGVWLAQKNTTSLLSANAHQSISAAVDQIKQYLQPAEHQGRFLARRIVQGQIDPENREEFGKMLTGALAAAPQISAVMFIDTNRQSFVAAHAPNNEVFLGTVDYSNDPITKNLMVGSSTSAKWGPPVWRREAGQTYIYLAQPVNRYGNFMGVIVAAVSIQGLSEFVGQSEFGDAGTRFILYGNDQVLAHASLVGGDPGGSNANPLPRLAGFGDPVLSSIWQKTGRHEMGMTMPKGTKGHVLGIYGERYVFLYQSLNGYGPKPLIVGTYFLTSDVNEEVVRMMYSLIAGLLTLVLSVIAALFLGRYIARPIVRFSAAAGQVRELEISQIDDLPGSVFRELNDQSVSFNAMLRGLRWFELYVPRAIVDRLIKRGDFRETLSDTRDITVLFTDMVGFSTASQGMAAPEVAKFVNHHFSLVAACIEAEGGTVDKFIGDAVMAFWDEPEERRERAIRACRAACAIAKAIRADNEHHKKTGKQPVGIRIGIHTGGATVGNIGAPGRINYTIIGDTVNIAQRLEQLGKEIFSKGRDVSILISADVAHELGNEFAPLPQGEQTLKGRAGKMEVFSLE